jgi:curved DNA-binding protein CbpA
METLLPGGMRVAEDFVDYYEFMQISPNAEAATIARVYKLLALRYHPDNPATGNLDKFLLLKNAFEVLSDPVKRSRYDAERQPNVEKPAQVFGLAEFSDGIDGERNRRMGILCLLYDRRRVHPDKPGISLLDLESYTLIPREHLLFPIWYLREKGLLRQDDSSQYVITAEGVDHLEANLPGNTMLHRLLKAAESSSVTPQPQSERG